MGGYTKGPWHIGGRPGQPIIYGPDGFAVADATVFHGTYKHGETDGNARLISAAPELLEALVDIINAEDAGEGWNPAYYRAKAAILKAQPQPLSPSPEKV